MSSTESLSIGADVANGSTSSGDEHPASTASSPRSARALAVTAVVAPLALGAAVLVHPADTTDAAASLARIAGDDRVWWVLTHLVEPAAWIALAVVFLAVRRLPATHGGLPLRAGATLAALGSAATSMIVYAHGEAYLHMTAEGVDTGAMEALYTRFQEEMPLVGPLSVAFQLGLVLLGVGIFRSRLAPRWAAVLFALTPAVIGAMSEASSPAVALGVVPMLVAMAATAPALRHHGSHASRRAVPA